MTAVHVGDLIVVRGRRPGQPGRSGEILEILRGGRERYLVRWDDGDEAVFAPGIDAVIESAGYADDEPVLVHEP
jgi:hypothetical protein